VRDCRPGKAGRPLIRTIAEVLQKWTHQCLEVRYRHPFSQSHDLVVCRANDSGLQPSRARDGF